MELLECQFSWFLLLSLYFNQLKKRKAFPHYQYLKYMMRVSEELEEVPATTLVYCTHVKTHSRGLTLRCVAAGEKKKDCLLYLTPNLHDRGTKHEYHKVREQANSTEIYTSSLWAYCNIKDIFIYIDSTDLTIQKPCLLLSNATWKYVLLLLHMWLSSLWSEIWHPSCFS